MKSEMEAGTVGRVERPQLIAVLHSHSFERRAPHPGTGISVSNHEFGAVLSTRCTLPEVRLAGVDNAGGKVDVVAVEAPGGFRLVDIGQKAHRMGRDL